MNTAELRFSAARELSACLLLGVSKRGPGESTVVRGAMLGERQAGLPQALQRGDIRLS